MRPVRTTAIRSRIWIFLLLCISCTPSDDTTGPVLEDPCLNARIEVPSHPFTLQALQTRRAAAFPKMDEDLGMGIAVWPSAWELGNADGDPKRQESDFYYLTGIDAAGVWLVLVRPEAGDNEIILYVDTAAVLVGPTERASDVTGVADVRCLSDGLEEVPAMIRAEGSPARTGWLYLSAGVLRGADSSVLAVVDTAGLTVAGAHFLLGASRRIKDAEEVHRLRRAAETTAQGLLVAMHSIQPGMLESDLEAVIESYLLGAGAARMSFPSIVASGANALEWHYDRNESVMVAGDLIVVDVGAEYGRYAGDVTRTFPVSGTFTSRQRALYELVLGAQQAAADAVLPGMTLEQLDALARDYMRVHSGDLCGPETCENYFGHWLSHFVGLELHDWGYQTETLREGMVITIEPGIYLPAEGLGIRIEDDYLLTATGALQLSTGVPSSVAAIEAAMADS